MEWKMIIVICERQECEWNHYGLFKGRPTFQAPLWREDLKVKGISVKTAGNLAEVQTRYLYSSTLKIEVPMKR
jgi:hypothetical protein